ncbi:MAG: anti-sigma factor [candidate division NC10 bacterium]|nr:anti-sigma factor [candidate division NC10 bacterium]
MSHEPYLELAASYALGALEGDERSRFEAHLREGCRECEVVVSECGETLAALAADLPPVTPPARLKAALMTRIGAETRPSRALDWRSPWWAPWRLTLAGALAVAAVAVLYLSWQVTTLDRELARRSGELADLRAKVAEQQQLLAVLRAPDTRVAALGGLKPSPAAHGRMWWNREAGGLFVAAGLPAAPGGKTYQLWAIAGGKPVSAGIFAVDAGGGATLPVKPLPSIGNVEVFAVTLEPAGGLPQPSGEMYLAGKVL